jgi:hypothetical protein
MYKLLLLIQAWACIAHPIIELPDLNNNGWDDVPIPHTSTKQALFNGFSIPVPTMPPIAPIAPIASIASIPTPIVFTGLLNAQNAAAGINTNPWIPSQQLQFPVFSSSVTNIEGIGVDMTTYPSYQPIQNYNNLPYASYIPPQVSLPTTTNRPNPFFTPQQWFPPSLPPIAG